MSSSSSSSSSSFSSSSSSSSSSDLTAHETEVYDRQVRLWGFETQKSMSSSRLLIVGLDSGLGAETAKNMILAGIGCVCVIDDRLSEEKHLASQFLIKHTDIVQSRPLADASLQSLRDLNPLVDVQVLSGSAETVYERFTDQELSTFMCVVASDLSTFSAVKLSTRLHSLHVPHFLCFSYGYSAVIFSDLTSSYNFVLTRNFIGKESQEVKTTIKYCSFLDAITAEHINLTSKNTSPAIFAWQALLGSEVSSSLSITSEQFLHERMIRNPATESVYKKEEILASMGQLKASRGLSLAPVCAVIGGMIGQEIVKIISKKDEPINNVFMFESMGLGGTVQRLH